MITKLREIGHLKALFEERIDAQGNEIPGLRNLYWAYIYSDLTEALDINREALYKAGGPIFRVYIDNEWRLKESKIIAIYTRKYANLGAHSSQRSKSYHNVMREITNA